jgi:MoxR-like ATPase
MVAVARRVRVADDLCTYIARVVARTRTHPAVALGASPRASLALLRSAQVVAASEGRGYVVPDDIKEMARPVLRHRFLMQADAELDGLTPDAVVDAVLVDVPVPGGERSG